MDAAIYKALSGAVAQTRRLEIVVQNLGNVNTPGYKAQSLSFSEVLNDQESSGAEESAGMVAANRVKSNMNPGEVYSTGNPLNLAILGDGYFAVETARGERYTRAGSFSLRGDGTLVTPQGDPVLGDGGPMVITGGKVEVTIDGLVSSSQGQVGKLKIVRLNNPQQALREGGNLFQVDPGNVSGAADVQIMQGGLEQSNVKPSEVLIQMVEAQRLYDMRTKLVATAKELDEGGAQLMRMS